jgi:hypothetical protein
MANIRLLQDITVYNSITAISGITTNTLSVNGDATITGNLTVTGSASFHNTDYTTTSAISVTNTGTGPALVVNQTGEEAIAAFYDDNSIAFYVDGKTGTAGYVGIGTSTPNEKLTVVGNISATGYIYGSNLLTKIVSAFGDGSNTSYEILHNMNTEDVIVSIIDVATKEVVYPSVVNYSVSSIKVEFSEAPALTAYKAVVIG